MGGMGLKLAPMLVRHPLGPLGVSEPIADTYWSHSYCKQS